MKYWHPLYEHYPFLQFINDNNVILLSITLPLFFVVFFNRLYVTALFMSILLLFFNLFFILDLPKFPFQFPYMNKDYPLFIQVLSLIVGVWGLIRSTKEVKTMVLDNERVLESHNFMVEGGAGHEQRMLDATEELIKNAHMPGVITEQKNVSPGMFGEKRKFLVVRHGRYKEWHVLIGARAFGEHLDASWFLAVTPNFFKRTVSKHATGNPTAFSQNVDFFSQQDIKAFKSVAFHCFKQALEALYEELKLDPSGLESGDKGFLNVW